MGFEPFWYHFWRLGIFDVFRWKIIFLMWGKNRQQSFVFLSDIFPLQITTIISALKFPSFKLQSIITFDLKAVDNFYCHICNKHIKLVNIPENKENRSPPQHMSTSPRPLPQKNQTYNFFFSSALIMELFFSKSGLFFKIFWPQIPTILRTFFVDKNRQREFTSAHRPFFDEKMAFFCVFLPKTTTIISVFYSPKESSLKNSPRGPIGRVLSLPCIIWLENSFTPKRYTSAR